MSPLRIDLVSPPFHGHLHPNLGLATALRGLATVRVLTTSDALGAVRAAGLEGIPLLQGHEAEVWSLPNTRRPVCGKPWMLWKQLSQNLALLPFLQADLQAFWGEERPDLAIVDFTLPSAGHLARSLGIHWWTSHVSPLAIETPDAPPTYLGGLLPADSLAARLRDALGRRCIRGFKRTAFALQARRLSPLGMSSPYRSDGSEQAYSDECILALGLQELEFARRWPKALRWVGPVLHNPALPSAGPRWDPRRRNVLVTLGTHLPYLRQRLPSLVRSWARALPDVHLHYTAGGQETGTQEGGDNWTVYPYLNYDRSLSRFDALVHHGGAGISYHALRTRRPVVVWPQDYDQFDFAARLQHRGLALWCRRPADMPALLTQAMGSGPELAAARPFAEAIEATDLTRSLRTALAECTSVRSLGPA